MNYKFVRVLLCFLIFNGSLSACSKDVKKEEEIKPKEENVKEEDDSIPPSFQTGEIINLGFQVFTETIQAGAFSTDPTTGELNAYSVVRGNPGHFIGFEASTGKLVIDKPITNSEGSWDMTVSIDGTVYASGDGYLYKHSPGSDVVENLGIVLPGQRSVWALVAGKNGEIFGTTWPGCRVFRYHPNEGFSDVARGPIVEGEEYARSIAYHEASDKLYVGIGTRARLVELNPRTRAKSEILPPEYHSYDFVYDLGITNGIVTGGDRLFIWLTRDQEKKSIIFNLSTKQVEKELRYKYFKAKSVTTSQDKKKAYFSDDVRLYSVDFSSSVYEPELENGFSGTAFSIKRENDGIVALSQSFGTTEIIYWTPDVGTTKRNLLSVPGRPVNIRSIVVGPDKKIWSSGFLIGQHTAYNPIDKALTFFSGITQTERMVVSDKSIYMGAYPGAKIYGYQTDKSWSMGNNNPKLIAEIPGQDRPFAAAAVKGGDKVFFGTVPDYGKLGGALVEVSESGKAEVFQSIIPDQSIITLLHLPSGSGPFNYGKMIGGTSTSGGLGIPPTQTEAKLFIWDVEKRKVEFETVPMPGKRAITGLTKEPDQDVVWAVADGTLFAYDLNSNEVIKELVLHTVSSSGQIWENADLYFYSPTELYGTAGNGFFKVDIETMQITLIDRDGKRLIFDEDNDTFYFVKSDQLFAYRLK